MGIFDGLMKRLGYYKAAGREMQSDHGTFPMAYAEEKRWQMPLPELFANQADLYRRLSWINSAVSVVAQTGATTRFGVKRRRGEDVIEITNHPFELLLEDPNSLQSRFEFLVTAFSYYKLTGNNYIWLNRTEPTAVPMEMWIVPPSEIVPVPDGNLFIQGYEYQPSNSAAMLIPPWQIVHVKSFNPHNQFLGLSPVESVARQSYSDLGKTERDSKLFNDQNGNPPGIMAFADNYSNDEWEQMQREVEERARKMKRFLMIRNTKQGGVNWLQTAMSNVDLQYLDSRRFAKEEIYDVFAPGLASMLSVNATEANSKTGKGTFGEYTLWPMLDALAQKITTSILPAYGLKLKGEFDDPRTKDRVLEMQEMSEYAKTHTISEVRQKYYQDAPLGDARDNLLPAQITATSGAEPKEAPPALAVAPPEMSQSPEPEDMPEPMDDDEMEIKRWKLKARKAIKAGRSANVNFNSEIIPAEYQSTIRAALAEAKTSEDIDRAFERVDPLAETVKRLTLALEGLAHD